ncbi:unnamed protein product [Zymoseptoria tritici ST99CH_3D1]|uniref:Uncharacterized protein n=1 Tax=Zymoseptoria tritici (strain CBS 115943 / IPO323) TaxID=336722 RepID=F9XJ85_ZYMTI|nr:uncharacterized protein MYCGRDRAFT_105682 [Zymoseptoria tritici IPO323]EGP84304.1 hypothetical protein MYCGRDRAFT_105682 [Zymoseptoria tritici IPO323]SMR61331.1 unnamed protein product [Zymoseptoria tritici ST99CH_3D1]
MLVLTAAAAALYGFAALPVALANPLALPATNPQCAAKLCHCCSGSIPLYDEHHRLIGFKRFDNGFIHSRIYGCRCSVPNDDGTDNDGCAGRCIPE